MARNRSVESFTGPVRRLVIGLILMLCVVSVLVWRIDNPRMERLRAAITDRLLPPMALVMRPVNGLALLVADFQSYARLYEQNQELRRELQQMRAWREAALQLDQENARLLELNNVRIDPALTWITGVVMADSGSPFRQSVLLNVGERDGIRDGWAAVDGLGLVGRIAGVGSRTARVMLLTDTSSRIAVTISPSGQKAILTGDNTFYPLLDFIENPDAVRPGDQVMTSGDGELFPPDILVGSVVLGTDQRLRLRLVADYQRLEYLRVLRSGEREEITDPGGLLVPPGGVPPDDEAPEVSLGESGLPSPPARPVPEPVSEPADG